jgi:dTDP-4-dehydrorhamnose 3,5-epimerase
MNIIETKIKDLLIFEPRVFADERGWFMESFNQKTLNRL